MEDLLPIATPELNSPNLTSAPDAALSLALHSQESAEELLGSGSPHCGDHWRDSIPLDRPAAIPP
ncbi:MAG: hypothetical protein ACLP59_19100 [Bryobacteraceae bacterium]